MSSVLLPSHRSQVSNVYNTKQSIDEYGAEFSESQINVHLESDVFQVPLANKVATNVAAETGRQFHQMFEADGPSFEGTGKSTSEVLEA